MSDSGETLIAVLITCYNRIALTERSISCLLQSQNIPGVTLRIFLVDDGSEDGTADMVREKFPEVCVIAGSGSLYWNGGMRLAYETASKIRPDYFLWLNDDTYLLRDALARLLASNRALSSNSDDACITTGILLDPRTGLVSYSGYLERRHGMRKILSKAPISKSVQICATMNGNCVLIPSEVANRLGNLDGVFTHAMGDMDYGYRATQAGFAIYAVPGVLGFCQKNNVRVEWEDDSLPIRRRWQFLLGPKGLPIKEWKVYARRHLGVMWPLYWIAPYLRFWTRTLARMMSLVGEKRLQ